MDLHLTNSGYEISLYDKEVIEPKDIAVEMARLKTAFPKQNEAFFNLLAERLIKNGFSKTRLRDAVNHTIDDFAYKELNISDIVKFDKRIKLYTYNEVCVLVTKGQADFKDFEIREISGSHFRVKKSDLM